MTESAESDICWHSWDVCVGLHGGIVGIRQAGYTWRFRVCVCPFGV